MVWDLGFKFRIWDSGFGIGIHLGLGFGVQGLGFKI
jgi:hypothetical protein